MDRAQDKAYMKNKIIPYTLITTQLFYYTSVAYSPFAISEDGEFSLKDKAPNVKYDALMSELASSLASQGNSENADVGNILQQKGIDIINNKAEGYLTDHAQDWLSQYGTASVNIEMDKFLKFKSGEVDVLIPFFKKIDGNNASTWFVQPGAIFNTDDNYNGRHFAHVGLGYRTKSENSFWGVNTFYDYDLTLSHQRLSLGLEYGRHYFKLNSNYYFPLSEWTESQSRFNSIGDGVLLEERPAQGVDVNFSGYLPVLPWLTLDATYLQYFGDNVESTSNGEPMTDPMTLKASLNLQPIPLISVNGGYSYTEGEIKGSSNKKITEDEITAGIDFTYRLGVPLSQQLSPSNVAQTKELDFQLLDLVDRDHNIRLEYRQALEPAAILFRSGPFDIEEKQSVPLSELFTVTGDKSQIKNLAFTGAAGNFIVNNSSFSAPNFIIRGNNTYPLHVIINLVNGTSKITDMPLQINVLENTVLVPLNIHDIDFKSNANPNDTIGTVGPEGTSGAGLVVSTVIKNKFGTPIPDKKAIFEAFHPEAGFSVKEVITSFDGVISSTLFSSIATAVPFTITIDGIVFEGNANFNARNSQPDESKSNLETSKSEIQANNVDKAKIKLILKDRFDNPLPGRPVELVALRNGAPITDGIQLNPSVRNANQTNEKGEFEILLSGSSEGLVTIRARVTGVNDFEETIPVRLSVTQAKPAIETSSLQATPSRIEANGTATTTLNLLLNDEFENPLPNQTAVFNVLLDGEPIASTGAGIELSEVQVVSPGVYRATLSGTKAGAYSVVASVTGVNGFSETANVTLTAQNATPSMDRSDVTLSKTEIAANNNDSTRVTLQLNDGNGNGLSGRNVTFSALIGQTPANQYQVAISPVIEGANGQYSANISGTLAGTITIKANIQGVAANEFEETATLRISAVNAMPSTQTSTFVSNSPTIVANGTAMATFSLNLRDLFENPLPGRTVTFTATRNGQPIDSSITKEDQTPTATGTYSTIIKGTSAGPVTVTATVAGANGFSVNQTITLNPVDVPSSGRSVMSLSRSEIAANDSDSTRVTLQLNDANGNGLSNKNVIFSAFNGQRPTNPYQVAITPVNEGVNGRYTADISGSLASDITIKANIQGVAASEFEVETMLTISAASAPPSSQVSTFSSNKDTIGVSDPANPNVNDTATFTLNLRDKFNNPLPGRAVTFIATRDGQLVDSSIIKEDQIPDNGTYGTQIRGSSLGPVTVTATVAGPGGFSVSDTITLNAISSLPSETRSTTEVAPPRIIADGIATSAITLNLKDGFGNPLSGRDVEFTVINAGNNVEIINKLDVGNGVYQASLRGTRVGVVNIRASVADISLSAFAKEASVTLVPVPFNLNWEEKRERIMKKAQVGVRRHSSLGHQMNPTSPIGYNVRTTFIGGTGGIDKTNVDEKAKSSTENSGLINVSDDIPSALVGVSPLGVPLIGMNDASSQDQKVDQEIDSDKLPSARTSYLASSNINVLANNSDTSTLTLLLKDKYGNAMSNENVLFSAYDSNNQLITKGLTISPTIEKNRGVYTATLKGTFVGNVTIVARAKGLSPFEAITAIKMISMVN